MLSLAEAASAVADFSSGLGVGFSGSGAGEGQYAESNGQVRKQSTFFMSSESH